MNYLMDGGSLKVVEMAAREGGNKVATRGPETAGDEAKAEGGKSAG